MLEVEIVKNDSYMTEFSCSSCTNKAKTSSIVCSYIEPQSLFQAYICEACITDAYKKIKELKNV